MLGALGAGVGLALGYAAAHLAVRAAGADLGAGMFQGVSADVEYRLRARWAISRPGFSSPCSARCCRRAMPRARLRRARLRRATSRRCSSALRRSGRDCSWSRREGCWRSWARCGAAAFRLRGDRLPAHGRDRAGPQDRGARFPVPAAAVLSAAAPRAGTAQGGARPGRQSLAAIVASFSLMAAMAIMVASFRESVDEWLARVLPAEVYFRTTHAGDTARSTRASKRACARCRKSRAQTSCAAAASCSIRLARRLS